MAENDLLDESNLQNLKQLFSTFGDIDKIEEVEDDDLQEEEPSEVIPNE